MWKLWKGENNMSQKNLDFDTIIDRRHTSCGKWDTMDQKYGSVDLIHLGVADMDFPSPQPIIDSFQKCLDHGIFGYTDLTDKYYEGFITWMKKRHSVEVKREEILFCPRINISSSLCVDTLTQKGQGVIIQTPAYGPLYQSIVKNNRKVLENPLKLEGDKYTIDFEKLEELSGPDTKMLILCSPHNPVGRVWTKEELEAVGRFCVEKDLLLFVDEIHGDITAKGVDFVSSLNLSPEVRERLVVATSLTKTFNIPGVILSYLVIPNQELRQKVADSIDRIGMHNPTIFSMAATETAYTECDDWYEAMLSYIDENENYTREYFSKYLPGFHIYPREGTYLLWMDYKALGLGEEDLEKWFLEEARVSVYMGTVFQEEGRGFIRVNIASPRKLLEQAYERMRKAYPKLNN